MPAHTAYRASRLVIDDTQGSIVATRQTSNVMLVLLSALLVVRASDIFQEDLLIRPIAEASSTSSDLPAAAAFHRAFLTSSYKERANKVKQTLKTKHSGAHVEPIPRTATHIPFLSLKLLFVGIWDSARGARPANCRGVQQHLRLTAAVCRPLGFCKRS